MMRLLTMMHLMAMVLLEVNTLLVVKAPATIAAHPSSDTRLSTPEACDPFLLVLLVFLPAAFGFCFITPHTPFSLRDAVCGLVFPVALRSS